jgi:hypothetical protein
VCVYRPLLHRAAGFHASALLGPVGAFRAREPGERCLRRAAPGLPPDGELPCPVSARLLAVRLPPAGDLPESGPGSRHARQLLPSLPGPVLLLSVPAPAPARHALEHGTRESAESAERAEPLRRTIKANATTRARFAILSPDHEGVDSEKYVVRLYVNSA